MRGVAAAHAAGITHRDIKPENIFIATDALHADGIAKILDFGISKLHDEPSSNLTVLGTAVGTPHYMSLEQIRGESDVDQRTDVYAFGVLLYRALTGALPYDAETLPGIVFQASMGRAIPPIELCPDLPQDLNEIILKAIALRRDDRFQSMGELIGALSRAQLALAFSATSSCGVAGASGRRTCPCPRPAFRLLGGGPGGRTRCSVLRSRARRAFTARRSDRSRHEARSIRGSVSSASRWG